MEGEGLKEDQNRVLISKPFLSYDPGPVFDRIYQKRGFFKRLINDDFDQGLLMFAHDAISAAVCRTAGLLKRERIPKKIFIRMLFYLCLINH